MSDLKTNLQSILQEKTNKIIPENIKKDVQIFNIVGTYEGSGGGSTVEGVKQFSTVEEMNASTGNTEGDLAIIYRNEIQNATADSRFRIATFPDTVVLNSAITDYTEFNYIAVDSSVTFGCTGSLDSSMFTMNYYTETRDVTIQYTSYDGITYTRDDTTGNPVDFGTEICYERREMWNDAIGKFIQVGGNTFEGLFEYQLSNERAIKGYKISSLALDANTDLINVGESIIGTGRIKEAWLKARDYFINQLNVMLDNGSACTALLKDANTIVFITEKTNGRLDLYYNGSSFSICSVNNSDYFNEIEINLSTLELAYKQIQPSVRGQVYNKENMPIFDQYKNYYILGYNEGKTMIGKYFSYYTTTKEVSTYEKPNLLLETSILQYIPAQTQLTTVADDVYSTKFYGKTGVTTGTLATNVSNSFADTNAAVYGNIQQAYDSMTPRVLTDTDKTIDKNIYFIPTKTDGTILLDTNKVTDMSYMFDGCTNLTTIPLLNTSNVTDMTQMFSGCTNLTTIPLLNTNSVTDTGNMFSNCTNLQTIPLLNTSSVTNMISMFYHCTNLQTIPLLNTSSVTNMSYMFSNCTNLQTVPLLDTSSVTNMACLFVSCTNLTTIPLLDTSSVTKMVDMLSGCTSLSDDSLNNILAMCTNATKMTSNKTLKRIGLTSAQAAKCKTLSNYSAFTAAGWKTGY